jgi:hypothetical protein
MRVGGEEGESGTSSYQDFWLVEEINLPAEKEKQPVL